MDWCGARRGRVGKGKGKNKNPNCRAVTSYTRQDCLLRHDRLQTMLSVHALKMTVAFFLSSLTGGN